jgi:hypothetical protein
MSRAFRKWCIAASMVVACTGLARADIVSLYGQKDGFGLPGAPAVPANGTLWQADYGGVYFTDYRNAYDLAHAPDTDIWFNQANVNWNQPTYSLAGLTPLTATLSMQMAGIANLGANATWGPYNVSFDGTVIGVIPHNTNANGDQEILTYTFNVPVALLTGADTILINTGSGDGFAMNFSELDITTASVPEPTSLASMALGGGLLFGLGAARRLRKARLAASA